MKKNIHTNHSFNGMEGKENEETIRSNQQNDKIKNKKFNAISDWLAIDLC